MGCKTIREWSWRRITHLLGSGSTCEATDLLWSIGNTIHFLTVLRSLALSDTGDNTTAKMCPMYLHAKYSVIPPYVSSVYIHKYACFAGNKIVIDAGDGVVFWHRKLLSKIANVTDQNNPKFVNWESEFECECECECVFLTTCTHINKHNILQWYVM